MLLYQWSGSQLSGNIATVYTNANGVADFQVTEPGASSYHYIAVSEFDGITYYSNAISVTVTAPAVAFNLTANSTTITAGQPFTLTATLTNSSRSSVLWQVDLL